MLWFILIHTSREFFLPILKFPCTCRWGKAPEKRLTSDSTMLDLLFRSVFTMWNTSMIFCCWIISHTLQMAQKVPLRPPPFLGAEGKRQEVKVGKAEGMGKSPAYTAAHTPVSLKDWLRAFRGLGKQRPTGQEAGMEGLSCSLAAVGREAPRTAVLLLAALGLTAAVGAELDMWQCCSSCVWAPAMRPTSTTERSRAFSATPHHRQENLWARML